VDRTGLHRGALKRRKGMRSATTNRLVMKKLSLLFLSVFLLSAFTHAEEVTVTVPQSADQFIELRDQLATTPEGGAACFVATLLAFSQSKEVGMQCLTIAIDQQNVGTGSVYKGHAPNSSVMYHVNRISGYNTWPYLGYAYIKGATAANNYRAEPPLVVDMYRQKNSGSDSSGQVKVFVNVDGFRARPITLKRNDKGIWKASEFSSLLLNVNPPASTKPTDDL
jgi:uncharacterized protein DUF6935